MADNLNAENVEASPTFENIVRENVNNIILSTPSNDRRSLCYLVPEGFNAVGVILVISPYVERINDEIEYLRLLNITATTITSETSIEDRENIYENFSHQFFFVTPEMINFGFERVRTFIDDLLNSRICSVVVEEADLSTYTTRESYQVLRNVRTRFPKIQWIAQTNTTNDERIQNIADNLSMTNYNRIIMRGPNDHNE